MANYYCEYCGASASSITMLTHNNCLRHPLGASKGKHKLYEGSEKSQYSCKYCGKTESTIQKLVNANCLRHPKGIAKGKHEPSL